MMHLFPLGKKMWQESRTIFMAETPEAPQPPSTELKQEHLDGIKDLDQIVDAEKTEANKAALKEKGAVERSLQKTMDTFSNGTQKQEFVNKINAQLAAEGKNYSVVVTMDKITLVPNALDPTKENEKASNETKAVAAKVVDFYRDQFGATDTDMKDSKELSKKIDAKMKTLNPEEQKMLMKDLTTMAVDLRQALTKQIKVEQGEAAKETLQTMEQALSDLSLDDSQMKEMDQKKFEEKMANTAKEIEGKLPKPDGMTQKQINDFVAKTTMQTGFLVTFDGEKFAVTPPKGTLDKLMNHIQGFFSWSESAADKTTDNKETMAQKKAKKDAETKKAEDAKKVVEDAEKAKAVEGMRNSVTNLNADVRNWFMDAQISADGKTLTVERKDKQNFTPDFKKDMEAMGIKFDGTKGTAEATPDLVNKVTARCEKSYAQLYPQAEEARQKPGTWVEEPGKGREFICTEGKIYSQGTDGKNLQVFGFKPDGTVEWKALKDNYLKDNKVTAIPTGSGAKFDGAKREWIVPTEMQLEEKKQEGLKLVKEAIGVEPELQTDGTYIVGLSDNNDDIEIKFENGKWQWQMEESGEWKDPSIGVNSKDTPKAFAEWNNITIADANKVRLALQKGNALV